jgi:hypothetical protein
MTTYISFSIINKHDHKIWLIVEPFGGGYELLCNQSYRLSFTSKDNNDISKAISISYKGETLVVWIEGGWIDFELFQGEISVFKIDI